MASGATESKIALLEVHEATKLTSLTYIFDLMMMRLLTIPKRLAYALTAEIKRTLLNLLRDPTNEIVKTSAIVKSQSVMRAWTYSLTTSATKELYSSDSDLSFQSVLS